MTELKDKLQKQIDNVASSYDEFPYAGYPYPQTSPYSVMAVAKLFGVNVPAMEQIKILELGCGEGDNLISMASQLPKAKLVGVDLSKVQIDAANKTKSALGLKNIEFHAMSITDINEAFGKFDYIICHGVISWVPEEVRKSIFEVCSKNLTENGVAYLSYNTLPGWNIVRTIRDMMRYHAGMFSTVHEKIAQAKSLVNFIKDSLENANTPYSQILKDEAQRLSLQNDSYIAHEFLEINNHQFYFSDFIFEAAQHGLQYLGDANLSTMYLGNMPQKVVEKLQEVKNIIVTEQYMDFITNRRFRTTLLCHNNIKIDRNIQNESIEKFNMICAVTPEKPLSEVNIEDSIEPIKFFYINNKDSHIATSSPLMKAVLYSFAENIANPLSISQLVELANKKLTGGNKAAEIKNEFLQNAMKLVLQGYINLTLRSNHPAPKTDKPKLYKLAQYQANIPNSFWVSSMNHEPVAINIVEKFIMKHMDGKHNLDQILDELIKHIKNGDLVLNQGDQKVEDVEMVKKDLAAFLKNTVEKFAVIGLLE